MSNRIFRLSRLNTPKEIPVRADLSLERAPIDQSGEASATVTHLAILSSQCDISFRSGKRRICRES
jgi:hypothetical protein